MNEYSKLASQVQSRLSKRSAQITCNEMWSVGFKYLQRYKDMRETKEILKGLRAEQALDKKLLQLAHAAAVDDIHWLED